MRNANEVCLEDAKKIVENGVKYYMEVSNMPTMADAQEYLIKAPGVIVAPSKAVNAGGVCVSGLEMSQNSQRLSWTAEEVDSKLHHAMVDIHKHSVEAAENTASAIIWLPAPISRALKRLPKR